MPPTYRTAWLIVPTREPSLAAPWRHPALARIGLPSASTRITVASFRTASESDDPKRRFEDRF